MIWLVVVNGLLVCKVLRVVVFMRLFWFCVMGLR